MKRSRVLVAALLVVYTACASSQQATAYKTLGAVVEAVYTAMGIYGDEVKAGHVSTENQLKVKKAYEEYQTVIGAAIRTRGLTGPVPDDVAISANAVLSLLKQLGVLK